jgi:putative DNA primase/helicase
MAARCAVNAETIARALGGRRIGTTWTARCPAHDDRTPSLSIRDADGSKVLVRCHAGCGQERVIDALRGRGLWVNAGCRPLSSKVCQRSPVKETADPDDTSRTEAALAIWRSTERAQGTLVDVYLGSRGIRLPAPDGLRFHPGLRHPSGGIWPAMVALQSTARSSRAMAGKRR